MSVYEELPDLTGKKNQTEIAKKAWESGSKHMEEQIQFNGQLKLIEQFKDLSIHE